MTAYPIYQIDAFTDTLFSGNPAAVMPLDGFFTDENMQNIAQENNLAETAFVVTRGDGSYDLRWFTPKAEIEFCGHATIASAHVLIHELGHLAPLVFHTQIGELTVKHSEQGYTLCAPNYTSQKIPIDAALTQAFGPNIISAHKAVNNIYVELANAQAVKDYAPNMAAIANYLMSLSKKTLHGASIMAAGYKGGEGNFANYDFVSRHFAPLHGVPEDPVTGSAHSALGPFWAKRLGQGEGGVDKAHMTALQCSERGGVLHLHVRPGEVQITGRALTYLKGEIYLSS